MRKTLMVLGVLVALPCPALADDVADRAAELAGIEKLVTSGTRFERIAALENIIDTRDLTKAQLAIKLGLASDDPDLRAVALRGYFSFNGRFTVSRSIPEAARTEVNNLVNQMKYENDPGAKVAAFSDKFGTSIIALKQFEFKTGKGSSATFGATSGFLPFVINGESVQFQVGGRITGSSSPQADCYYDLRLAGTALKGPVNCGQETPAGATAEIRLY